MPEFGTAWKDNLALGAETTTLKRMITFCWVVHVGLANPTSVTVGALNGATLITAVLEAAVQPVAAAMPVKLTLYPADQLPVL